MTKKEIYNRLQNGIDDYREHAQGYEDRAKEYIGKNKDEEFFLVGLSTAYFNVASDLERFLEKLLPDVQKSEVEK